MNSRSASISKIKLPIILVAAAFFLTALMFDFGYEKTVLASRFGPSPTFSGATGEANCTACHGSFPVNSGTGNITISGVPKRYTPGQEIPVTVRVSQEDAVRYGFQMTAIDSDGNKIGTYTLPSTVPSPLELETGFVGLSERQYIQHTSNGVTPTEFGSKSWTFTFTAPAQRSGKIRFFAAGNGADGGGGTSGDYIYTTSTSTNSGKTIADFDNDSYTDFALFRPSNGVWYSVDRTGTQFRTVQVGMAGDIPVPGDYNGDGITDRMVFRPSEGKWYGLFSNGVYQTFGFGLPGDIPISGDFDGDGFSDLALFRKSTGYWYIAYWNGGFDIVKWGIDNDIPVVGDYDGDGKTDIAVFRPSTRIWYLLKSTAGIEYYQFGLSDDLTVQADYDGDGRQDIAVFRPSNAQWWIVSSRTGQVSTIPFGLPGDSPSPGDYDGDGKADVTVFRPSAGQWHTYRSIDNTFFSMPWGQPGDISIPNSYLPR